MGLFEKLGLVEATTSEPGIGCAYVSDPAPNMEVEAEISSVANVVDEIYAQNNLGDKSNSIFTVQALIDTLPAEMTTPKKQATVFGILAVSGKSLSDLLADANERVSVLNVAQESIVRGRTDEINIAKADIEQLKQAIEAANIKIKEAEDIIEATKMSVSHELGEISALVEFCNGMEVQK